MPRRGPISVLYLAPWVTVGGSDRATIDWLRHVSSTGFRKYLVTTQPADNALFGEAEGWADEAWCLPELVPGDRMPAFIAEFVASRRVDVVHVMNSKLGFDMLPALRQAFPGLRSVAQMHAEEPDHAGYPAYVATRFDAAVDGYSVISQELQRILVGYGVAPAKTHLIYLGVDAGIFDPDTGESAHRGPPGPLRILCPHRLVEQKDPLLMVRIAGGLRDAGSDATVHVVGDGPQRSAVEDAVAAAGLADRIVLHGAQSDMAPWYRATDVTLLTSTYEGLPLVVFEAMAMRHPVVTPDVGAVGEAVHAGVGRLVGRRDLVTEYVHHLLELERKPALRRELGEEGRRQVLARFTLSTMAARHEGLYRTLVAS